MAAELTFILEVREVKGVIAHCVRLEVKAKCFSVYKQIEAATAAGKRAM